MAGWRNGLAMLASALLLSLAMVTWPALFLFSKTVHWPAWTQLLPYPLHAPACLAFVALIPVVLLSSTVWHAAKGAVVSVWVASLFPVAAYAINPIHQNSYLWANVLFNYGWIVLFHCTIPAVALLAMRAGVHYLRWKIQS